MSFGAMENWGLITYREYFLHIDERRDTFLRKRSATSIIGHELIHQWFGNLVTCDWWDEIYINEAFGSIGGYLGLVWANETTGAEYQWEDEYLCSQTFSGMNTDSRNTSRPMVCTYHLRGSQFEIAALAPHKAWRNYTRSEKNYF